MIGINEDHSQQMSRNVFKLLLTDNSAKHNIVWATDDYREYGEMYSADCEITENLITGEYSSVIRPRVTKAAEEQNSRTKSKAEVFTPSWICNWQNGLVDEQWFGRPDVFNTAEGTKWKAHKEKIIFTGKQGKTWQDYVRAERLEITCGEAPYLVSRYDTVTGKMIGDVNNRIGILDRKLRVVNENTDDESDWLSWAKKAYQSTYGYEYQGDSLLLARENLLFTFIDNMIYKFGRTPDKSELRQIAYIISWNIWQMDGLTYTAPLDTEKKAAPCIIRDWANKRYIEFGELIKSETSAFDAAVGNPPYHITNLGGGSGSDPIYHLFIDASRAVSGKGSFIHPGRFLFNAGKTPKKWNKKMLGDIHFKVVDYWKNSEDIFPGVDVKGGIAVTYWDEQQDFGETGTFTVYPQLRSIIRKVLGHSNFSSFADIVYPRDLYKLNEVLYTENEWAAERPSKGHRYDVGTNVFDVFPELFTDEMPDDGEKYAQILGRKRQIRTHKWVRQKYLKLPDNFEFYKVFVAKANGSGVLGEPLSCPTVGKPYEGHTVTFLSIGRFETENEAAAANKYIMTKFARTMLGTLKATQDNPKETWLNVPMQDFTDNSDIDWSKSISEIDKQLYAKYGLSQAETEFIETAAKPMNL